ncbi:MAG: L-seryl-tRNA(Sec) selenium transferase [Anaerolineaceae bacterium]|nr:MAG: L-seryl-tRNA(Sec) selenium transferase [Anaerolineales bacterium]GIK09581.1 MAG: L-seryl-tRNA(Sec) selenium transferase [Chloroflexota bacterium]GJQ38579.1 MAG: L-seryl-tRNA(Sec) selenium transferase [Anaerolineaceae bacterium]HMM97524.1 L-seryl-tRNA(Sec) selenium transferase [Anaerolineales bacterium]
MTTNLRDLPSVEQLLQTPRLADLVTRFGRPLALDAVRFSLDEARDAAKSGVDLPPRDSLVSRAEAILDEWTRPTLQPVVNATGVILHTNLGRAPMSRAALDAMTLAARGYSNLEFDLSTGKRGSRTVHAEALLQKLTGAESALVVNNNAGAVLLVLSALAKGKRVVIARTQLVEIGGSFRVPDVMKQSGAKLAEVGATNKVHLKDYKEALTDGAAMVLRAHRSNFKIVGFTEEPPLEKIANLAHEFHVPFVDDLGSGALLDTAKFGLGHEPTVQESLAAGADLVCFSGDKLLGGPQGGIIVGRKDLLDRIKRHPLARAVRADKLCLAALGATLTHYLKDEATREVPVWRMISMEPRAVKVRAEAWRERLGQGEVAASESTVGGGSLPDESMPTFVLSLSVKNPDKFLKRLRESNPPIIARTEADKILLDPRTVLVEQDISLLSALYSLLSEFK